MIQGRPSSKFNFIVNVFTQLRVDDSVWPCIRIKLYSAKEYNYMVCKEVLMFMQL